MFWYLTISTWRNFGGGKHWYGRLRFVEDEAHPELDLERPMSAKEIRDANRREGWTIYRRGDKTKAFPTADAVRAAALASFVERAAPRDLLLEGNWASADPMPVLAGPASHLSLLQEINAAWEAIGGWTQSKHRSRAEKLSLEWDRLLAELRA